MDKISTEIEVGEPCEDIKTAAAGVLVARRRRAEQLAIAEDNATGAFWLVGGILAIVVVPSLQPQASHPSSGFPGLLLAPAMYGAYRLFRKRVVTDKHLEKAAELNGEHLQPAVIIPVPLRIDRETLAGDFTEWLVALDTCLESLGSPTRHIHFDGDALQYGFANNMTPDSFVRTGYNKRL